MHGNFCSAHANFTRKILNCVLLTICGGMNFGRKFSAWNARSRPAWLIPRSLPLDTFPCVSAVRELTRRPFSCKQKSVCVHLAKYRYVPWDIWKWRKPDTGLQVQKSGRSVGWRVAQHKKQNIQKGKVFQFQTTFADATFQLLEDERTHKFWDLFCTGEETADAEKSPVLSFAKHIVWSRCHPAICLHFCSLRSSLIRSGVPLCQTFVFI